MFLGEKYFNSELIDYVLKLIFNTLNLKYLNF